MSSSAEGIYEPGIIDPGLPVSNPTTPFWLSQPSRLSNFQSPWPADDTVDVAVIGSGMTSASLCRTLLAKDPSLRIVVIEARELCSGATGRNGGHCKAMSPGIWFDRVGKYGVEEARRVMWFEHGHLEVMGDCVREIKDGGGSDCDFRVVEGLDVYYDEMVFKRAVDAVEDIERNDAELGKKYTVYAGPEELKARNLGEKDIVGAVGMSAGTFWPYKFVTQLFEKMIECDSLMIQTGTVVTSVDDDEGDEAATIHTSRGTLRACHVVHATNSWVGHLLHEIRPFVSPVRANVQRQVPQQSSTLKVDDTYSFWLRYGEHEYDYLIQRPDNAFILGRANTGRRATADDSKIDLIPQAHLRGVTPQVFNFGTDKLDTTHAWGGAVAFTEDGNPFVGRLPFAGRNHQWVCGAYQGIGMVRAFRAAEMLALLILGEDVPPEYPRSMLLTEGRVRALQKTAFPGKV